MPGQLLLDLSPKHFLKECQGHLLAGEYASFNSTSSAVKVAKFPYNPMLHLHINLSPSLSLFLVLTVHICNVLWDCFAFGTWNNLLWYNPSVCSFPIKKRILIIFLRFHFCFLRCWYGRNSSRNSVSGIRLIFFQEWQSLHVHSPWYLNIKKLSLLVCVYHNFWI